MSDIEFSPVDLFNLSTRLRELEQELQTKALRAGLREAGKSMAAAAEQLAPRDKGDLADGINTTVLDKRRSRQLVLHLGARERLAVENPGQMMVIGPNKKVKMKHQGFKGALMEFGTEAGMRKAPFRHRKDSDGNILQHRVRKRNGRWGRMVNTRFRGARYYSKGVKAQPYLQPAYEQTSGQFDTLFYTGLERYLNRIDRQKAKGKA